NNMTLTQRERDLIKASFHMGYKAANQIHGREPSSLVENTVDLLIPVYEGKATMHPTGAEIRLRNPEFAGDVESILRDNAPWDKIIAAVMLGKQ
ncbi:MAG: hypothetical protein ACOVQH_09550, partial [Burkholderiaceae bacterium]